MRRICASFVLGLISCGGGEDPPPEGVDGLPAQLKQLIDDAVVSGFSGSILVRVDGDILAESGYGLANRDDEIANGAETAFGFGSVIKEMTAAAIFHLEHDGLLSIDETLTSFFDEVPTDKADITVVELIQHRAGFATYHDMEGDFEPMTRLEARARIFEQTLLFTPGTESEYSNAGYTLLADIIETRSGVDYATYVRQQLFDPARMDLSGFFGESIWATGQTAIGYEGRVFGDNDPASWPYTWALVGNGGLVSTVGDIDRWATAIWTEGVLPAAARDRYIEYFVGLEPDDLAEGTAIVSAGGGDFGFGGLILELPEASRRAVIATNSAREFDIERLAIDLEDVLLRP